MMYSCSRQGESLHERHRASQDAHPTTRSAPDGYRRRSGCAGTTGTSRRPFPWLVPRRAARLLYFRCD
eukprot:COSAG01_NODE_18508_length_1071_cov_2.054527_1_plen_67_part_10